VNDFRVVPYERDPSEVVDRMRSLEDVSRDVPFIELEEFATYLDYPLNVYPYNPWPYMYLYPYARLRPSVYTSRYGPYSRSWYIFPTESGLVSNFWDYATTGWVDRGIWIIPPGSYWEGSFSVDDPYAPYYLRVLPFVTRENQSYMHLQMEINGTLVQPSIDITGAIGWGNYWTSDPFAYYNLSTLLHSGENEIRLYWPEEMEENLELQMVDVQPAEVVEEEVEEAREDAEEGEGNGETG